MQIDLNGNQLSDIDLLYLKRKIIYNELNDFIKLHKILIVAKVKSYKIACYEIDKQIEHINKQRCKNGNKKACKERC